MLTNEQAKTMDQGLLMVSPVRSRFQQKDMRLMNALDGEHQYLCEQVDPIISQGLHSVMLLQPTRVETFFGAYWKGNVPEKITKSSLGRQEYYDTQVKDLVAKAMEHIVRDKPQDIRLYLSDYFSALSSS